MPSAPTQTLPLWRQLQACARLVAGVRAGRSLTAELAGVDALLRPGAQALSFHVLRWLGLAQALRAQGQVRAAADAQAGFETAWARADVWLTASRF